MNELFDAGLVIQGQMDEFDAMAESDSWNQRYHQLGKGGFLGRSSIVNSPLVQLAQTSYQPVSTDPGLATRCAGVCFSPNEPSLNTMAVVRVLHRRYSAAVA